MKPFLALVAAGALCVPMAVHAASSVVIWPVDPSMDVKDKATALWLENRGTEPVVLQIRSFAWGQKNGEETYDAQQEIVASPPLAKIAPGVRQLVRLIKVKGPADGSERAYRLIIDELPTPRLDTDNGRPTADLAIQMRYSVPLFVRGGGLSAGSAPTGISAAVIIEGGQRYVQIANRGNVHARLTDLGVNGRGQTIQIKAGLVGYVLPGATMRWPLPSDAPVNGAIRVSINGAEQTLASGA